MDFSACPQILFGPEQEGPPQMSPTGPSGPDAASFSGSLERDWWALRPGSWGGGSMYLIKTFLTVAPSQCANEVACRTFFFRDSDGFCVFDRFSLLTV